MQNTGVILKAIGNKISKLDSKNVVEFIIDFNYSLISLTEEIRRYVFWDVILVFLYT